VKVWNGSVLTAPLWLDGVGEVKADDPDPLCAVAAFRGHRSKRRVRITRPEVARSFGSGPLQRHKHGRVGQNSDARDLELDSGSN
jgi:hypothetical protein